MTLSKTQHALLSLHLIRENLTSALVIGLPLAKTIPSLSVIVKDMLSSENSYVSTSKGSGAPSFEKNLKRFS